MEKKGKNFILVVIGILIIITIVCVIYSNKVEKDFAGYWMYDDRFDYYYDGYFPEYLYLFSDGTGECDGKSIEWSAENGKFRLSINSDGGYSEIFNYEKDKDVLFLKNSDGEGMNYYKE